MSNKEKVVPVIKTKASTQFNYSIMSIRQGQFFRYGKIALEIPSKAVLEKRSIVHLEG